MEKRNGFNVGDRVIVTTDRYSAYTNLSCVVIFADDTLDYEYFVSCDGDGGRGLWLGNKDIEHDKNYIVTQILNDL